MSYRETNPIHEELVGYGIEIVFGVAQAIATLIKSSPYLLIIWILFIAPNC